MGLDIRYPIGYLFSLIGLMLTIFGLVTGSNTEMYHRSLDINVNLWTGLGMLIIGILMLSLAYISTKKKAGKKEE
ncbi:MAG: hypothetical protein J7K53_03405 [Bacteroidales bacterium]|nr:hypothetical protein [Bacteroidales bacterium]